MSAPHGVRGTHVDSSGSQCPLAEEQFTSEGAATCAVVSTFKPTSVATCVHPIHAVAWNGLLCAVCVQGIAVGIATKIPPHNLAEVVAALEALVHQPDITPAQLMTHTPAPDFPTGALLQCCQCCYVFGCHVFHGATAQPGPVTLMTALVVLTATSGNVCGQLIKWPEILSAKPAVSVDCSNLTHCTSLQSSKL